MPFYNYLCRSCGNSKRRLKTSEKSKEHTEVCESCGGTLSYALGAPNAQAMETSDEYRGKSIEMGVSDKIRERADEHFRKHELPRMIEKEGREWAIRNGYLDLDGNVKK